MWALSLLAIGEGALEDRVAEARRVAGPRVMQMRRAAGLKSSPGVVYLRAFKSERVLEVWGAESASGPFKLIHSYAVAAQSGVLGPKRKEGDLQVPEGLYVVDRMNPQSRFHLSIGINYPNVSDRILGDREKPGSDIFIHGDKKSIGCLAMTDAKIKEIYLMVLDARAGGQRIVRVDIFPFRMTPEHVKSQSAAHPGHAVLWRQLSPAYAEFEKTRKVPAFSVNTKGAYVVKTG